MCQQVSLKVLAGAGRCHKKLRQVLAPGMAWCAPSVLKDSAVLTQHSGALFQSEDTTQGLLCTIKFHTINTRLHVLCSSWDSQHNACCASFNFRQSTQGGAPTA